METQREAVAEIVYAAMWPNNDPAVPWSAIKNEAAKAPVYEATDRLIALIVPAGHAVVPLEPTDDMAGAGAHCNSEWLNDNAPIGESRYREPAMAVWRTMLRISAGEDPRHGWKDDDGQP